MYRVQRKKRGGGLMLLLFLCVLAIGIGIGYGIMTTESLNEKEEITPKMSTQKNENVMQNHMDSPEELPAQANLAEAETPKNEIASYLVAEEEGDVCVFTIDEAGVRRFSHKIPVELSSLKEADRRLFRMGIQVSSKEDLLSLMEDFAS